jgi:hypothetical protein
MRRTGYSVFIKYRQRRLGLKRFLPSFEDAAAFAEEMRKTRFHSSEDIYIVDEATGEVVPAPPSPVQRRDDSLTASDADEALESVEDELERTTRTLESLMRTRRDLQDRVAALRAARVTASERSPSGANGLQEHELRPGSVPQAPEDEPHSDRSLPTDGLAKCSTGNGASARVSSSGNGD